MNSKAKIGMAVIALLACIYFFMPAHQKSTWEKGLDVQMNAGWDTCNDYRAKKGTTFENA